MTSTDMSQNPSADLIRSLIEHLHYRTDEWETMAMVIDIGPRGLRGTRGCVYPPDGSLQTAACRRSGIWEAARAYLDSKYQSGEEFPVGLLVQFDHTSGQYEFTFEDSDTARRKVSQ